MTEEAVINTLGFIFLVLLLVVLVLISIVVIVFLCKEIKRIYHGRET